MFFLGIAAAFGLQALRLPLGQLEESGLGLFPAAVSCMLAVVGLLILVRSAVLDHTKLEFSFKNIGVVLAGLVAFAAASEWLNVAIGIVVLVFIASLAAKTFSVRRCVILSVCLIACLTTLVLPRSAVALMDIVHNLAFGFGHALTWQNLLFCAAGCTVGTLVGLLPGLGPLATVSLLLPLTYSIPTGGALIMLAGIYYGAQYGDSVSAITMKMPHARSVSR